MTSEATWAWRRKRSTSSAVSVGGAAQHLQGDGSLQARIARPPCLDRAVLPNQLEELVVGDRSRGGHAPNWVEGQLEGLGHSGPLGEPIVLCLRGTARREVAVGCVPE